MPGVDVDEWVRATRKLCPFACGLYIEEGLTVAIEWLGAGVNIVKDDRSMMPVHQQQRSVRVCRRTRTGRDECLIYEDDVDVPGDFVSPKLRPGELFPIIWREGDDDDDDDGAADNGKRTTTVATDYAFQVGLPPELTTELLAYCDRLGVTEELRKLTGNNPLLASSEITNKFHTMADGNDWYVQRPPLRWTSNMHWISPADERTHEEYLDVLARGKFDVVLDAIGKHLGLEGLVAYHLTFIGVSHSEKGFMHDDSAFTGGSVYNVIIPLILEDDATPDPPPRSTMATRRLSGELAIMQDGKNRSSRYGAMKYRLGTAVMLGDDALHGTEACDYREKNGMRLAATVYIADITDKNAKRIAEQTLTQIFPLADARWLIAEAGRHWVSENYDGRSLLHNKGRNYFPFRDLLPDCTARANERKCISDIEVTRVKCVKSCGIYEPNKYEVYQYIDAFFDNLYDDEDSCIDDSDECEENARNDMCLTNPHHMEKLGCNMSCLYCLTQGSRALFSLGVEQTTEESNDDDVANVMAMSELYFVREVFLDDNLKNYRLACQNKDSLCAEWAAKGQCETSPGVPSGDMVKNCPAACRQCSMVDIRERCPVDEETNIFKPGDMNAMFERWLKEAGQDTTIFSRDNLPTGGTIPVGDLNVVISPYHDKTQLPKDEDEDEETMPALPWVVSIDGFLSEEECEKLIELGESIGYVRSTEYDSDDTSKHTISEGRTSYNTFCMEGCDDDPVVKGVIERMTKLTGIPCNNYEYLQLVRYETGQFYVEHHDLAPIHYTSSFGPRILTFFLYLNDATSGLEIGGGTAFRYLNFTATPKKGMALVWPSMMDNLEGIDDWTWHMALPVEKGVKYGANVWIHLRDYQNKPDYCDL
jgi:prolyl 4-hydroxylase